MHHWIQFVRIVALGLLLLTGFEVLGCDLTSPGYCKLSAAHRGTGSTQGAGDSDDTCLCCCTHYVAPQPMQLVEFAILGVPPVLVPAPSPLLEPSRILHPPRA